MKPAIVLLKHLINPFIDLASVFGKVAIGVSSHDKDILYWDLASVLRVLHTQPTCRLEWLTRNDFSLCNGMTRPRRLSSNPITQVPI